MKLEDDFNTNYGVSPPNEEWKKKYGTITINHNFGKDIDTLDKLKNAVEIVEKTDTLADGDRAISLKEVIKLVTYIGREFNIKSLDDRIHYILDEINELPSVTQAKIDYGYIKKIAEFFREWDGNEDATLEFSVSELRNIIHDHTLKCNLQNKVDELNSSQKGHWRAVYQGDEIINYRCSECEFGNTFGRSVYRMNFCPNCGADMRKGD